MAKSLKKEIFEALKRRFPRAVENYNFDTLRFSDLYRRGARFPDCRFGIDDELARLIRDLGVRATYHYTECAADAQVNEENLARCIRHIKDIEWRAREIGAEKIILPFGHPNHIFAQRLIKKIQEEDFSISLELREEEYNLDLSYVGPIEENKPTIFDEGIRGVCHYSMDLRYKWDMQVA